MPVIHAVTNFSGNAGDSNAVMSISAKIKEATIIEHKIDNPESNAAKEFAVSLQEGNDHVLILAGAKGLEFLQAALRYSSVQEALGQGKLIISWSGHQIPKEMDGLEDNLTVVGVLEDAIAYEPTIKEKFGTRLIPTAFVANTLTLDDLKSGKKLVEWNANHSTQQIPVKLPENLTGMIGAFLPGDTERLRNEGQNFYTTDEANSLGLALGHEALENKKFLLSTNGPRMGKFDHTSDPSKPKLREPKPHIKGAPIDPVTAAFLAGIEASGLPKEQYLFIDFIAGDSAYVAIACALYKFKDSIVYYGAESISNVELADFFDTTAIKVSVMTEISMGFLTKCINLSRVSCAELTSGNRLVIIDRVDPQFKDLFKHQNSSRDAQALANKIMQELRQAPALRVANRSKVLLHTMQAMQQLPSTSEQPTQTPKPSVEKLVCS